MIRTGARVKYENLRYGANVSSLEWAHSTETTAPSAGTTLVYKYCDSGKTGYLVGYAISSDEDNTFEIKYIGTDGGTTYTTIPLVIPAGGTTIHTFDNYIAKFYNSSLNQPSVTLSNKYAANTGKIYSASLLYGMGDV